MPATFVTLLFYLQTRYNWLFCCDYFYQPALCRLCVCTLWTQCLLQNLKIEKWNKFTKKYIFYNLLIVKGAWT